MLKVNDLTVSFGSKKILDNVSFSVKPGEWLMIFGPNGSGKSTTVSAISGAVPYTGEIILEGKDIKSYPRKALAAKVGVLLQNHYVGYGFTVEEVVRLGRYAHKPKLFSSEKDSSEELVQRALKITGMDAYRNQSIMTLSGGELQRTFLAQLLAQNPEVLILDEPTNHLDLVYQKQIFELIEEWRKTTGGTVISVVHDLSLARIYGTKGVLIQKGKVRYSDEMDKILTRDRLKDVYNMDVYAWMKKMYGQWEV